MEVADFFSFLFFAVSICITNAKISCLDPDGQPVDMYVLYKLPAITWRDVPEYIHNGTGYAYLDNKSLDFKLSATRITSPDSVAGRTLNQVYKAFEDGKTPSDQAHVFYNDANPEGKEFFTSGHTKGALAFDNESGFWMIHSVPHYPPVATDGYAYPHSGHLYGQMYLCVTLNSSSVINDIGLQLRYNNPHLHDHHLPSSMDILYPNIDHLVQGNMMKSSPYFHIQPFQSQNGIQFESFAKANDYHKDLYSQLVAPSLKTNLLTETWQHGSENIGSSCDGQFTVEDITNINLEFSSGDAYLFYDMNDHSKFAVSKSSVAPYVCIGDINRQTSQFKRGGGTVCTKNSALWERFNVLAARVNSC